MLAIAITVCRYKPSNFCTDLC